MRPSGPASCWCCPQKRLKGWKAPARPCAASCMRGRPSASPPRWRPCKGCCSSGSTGGWPDFCWPKAKKRRARGAYDARGACAALSSAREVVARTLKRFADAGLVELRLRRGAADRSRAAARAGGVVRGRALTAEAVIGTRKNFFGHCDLVIVFAFVLRVY